jgi:hypothetical protein
MTVRVRKARRSLRLACGHYVQRGQLEASRGGRAWVCIDCQLAAIRAAQSERPAEAGRTPQREG